MNVHVWITNVTDTKRPKLLLFFPTKTLKSSSSMSGILAKSLFFNVPNDYFDFRIHKRLSSASFERIHLCMASMSHLLFECFIFLHPMISSANWMRRVAKFSELNKFSSIYFWLNSNHFVFRLFSQWTCVLCVCLQNMWTVNFQETKISMKFAFLCVQDELKKLTFKNDVAFLFYQINRWNNQIYRANLWDQLCFTILWITIAAIWLTCI